MKVNRYPCSGPRTLSLDQALALIAARGFILCYHEALIVDIWTCGRKASPALRRAVYRDRETLSAMMHKGDPAVCPAPLWHHRYWRKRRAGVVCTACQRLDAFLA